MTENLNLEDIEFMTKLVRRQGNITDVEQRLADTIDMLVSVIRAGRVSLEGMRVAGNWAAEGLQVDGAHHKQWYLEQIAAALGRKVDHLEYEPGIPA